MSKPMRRNDMICIKSEFHDTYTTIATV